MKVDKKRTNGRTEMETRQKVTNFNSLLSQKKKGEGPRVERVVEVSVGSGVVQFEVFWSSTVNRHDESITLVT